VVTGDSGISPYRSGPKLVKFFNELGANDVYASGFPSRWYYTEGKIRELNDTPILARVFESVLDPRDYIGTKLAIDAVVDHLNEYLQYDGFEIVKLAKTYKVHELSDVLIELELPSEGLSKLTHLFIEEQIKKCDLKVFEGDFAGAITNARSLLEAVLLEVEQELTHENVAYDGDLPRLWRRVQGQLHLDPSRKDIADALRQVFSGLTATISGLATLRNKMSDAHATTYVASKRHAKLAVNAAKTIADFVIETFLEESGQAFDAPDKIHNHQKAAEH
jgi:hypothetical protein